LPQHETLILDLTPRQILQLEGLDITDSYQRKLQTYRQGMGVFKIDWALSEPVPFKDPRCGQAATVHIGNTYEEIVRAEKEIHRGKLIDKPFVLFAQQSLSDPTRAPKGKQTGWAYCHVPNG